VRYRQMLKSKIHRVTVTGTELDYEGSITIDQDLLSRADILPNEQVHVLNVTSGARFVTYAIAAPPGSGKVILNGAAARLGTPGDKLIVLAYCLVDEEEAPRFEPKLVLGDEQDRPH
jgi:aspartate 1-decarboxylase